MTASSCKTTDPDDVFEWPLLADSVEKVAPLADLRQNLFIGRRGITQHDGTVIEWAGATVLLL
uniref:hypothetical protein n=1 Tax=Pseudomonas brenneri TaxID=129817 RepID=UPI003BA07D9A